MTTSSIDIDQYQVVHHLVPSEPKLLYIVDKIRTTIWGGPPTLQTPLTSVISPLFTSKTEACATTVQKYPVLGGMCNNYLRGIIYVIQPICITN